MIKTEQSITIDANVESAWDYVKEIERWAGLLPGCRDCSVIDPNNSRWTLKVGAGGLVRTVKVLVHIDHWQGPEQVLFSFKLEGDPVEGGGSYRASRRGDRQTDVVMTVRVQGSGPMAPMWEGISKPLLPLLARSFAGKLKAEIEKAVEARTPAV